jgi:hypothetical protein
MSSSIRIAGIGAVSPFGWGVAPLLEGLAAPTERPDASHLARATASGETITTPAMRVPEAPAGLLPRSPRLRRTSPITRFAAAATAEALAGCQDTSNIGVIFTLSNGCVNYSNRFFTETLADPATASPILFPETVFNAPSSHLSAMLGSRAPNDTLIADAAGFFCGLELAIDWLNDGNVDGCIIVCAEEIDWLSAEGLRLYHQQLLPSEGAAALYLTNNPGAGIDMVALPDPIPFNITPRHRAGRAIRNALDPFADGDTLLVDGRTGIPALDAVETGAWRDWAGPRWSPRTRLGESMGASAGLQCAAACAAVAAGLHHKAIVTAIGGNQQAGGLVVARHDAGA